MSKVASEVQYTDVVSSDTHFYIGSTHTPYFLKRVCIVSSARLLHWLSYLSDSDAAPTTTASRKIPVRAVFCVVDAQHERNQGSTQEGKKKAL